MSRLSSVPLIALLFIVAGCVSSGKPTQSAGKSTQPGRAFTADVTADRLFLLAKQAARSNGYHNFEFDPYSYSEASQSTSAWKEAPVAFESSSRSFSTTSRSGTNQPHIELHIGVYPEGVKSTVKLFAVVKNARSSSMAHNIEESEERFLLRKITEVAERHIARR